MNREIKFRAWIPDYKEVIVLDNTGVQKFDCENGFSLMFTADNYREIWAHENYGIVKDAVVMQYTGLKDKNGKEIYEGDVLKFINGNTGYVVYDYLKTQVDYEDFNCLCFCCALFKNGSGNVTIERTDEIIGNIYETPELLQNK